MAIWVLLIVLWQPVGPPAVNAAEIATKAKCLSLLHTFVAGETAINESAPYWANQDRWDATCQLRTGNLKDRT